MIKNLIFDFGKVLVDYNFGLFFEKYIPDVKRRNDFAPLLYNEDIQRLLDRELVPFEQIVTDIKAHYPEYSHEISLFENHYPEIVTGEVHGMRELLGKLKKEGFALYGLTNWCSKVHITMAQYEIFDLLDGWVISSEEHTIKPEAAIYQRLFEKYGLIPSECLFTDDRMENIVGALRVGMRGIVFVDAVQYERELRTMIQL